MPQQFDSFPTIHFENDTPLTTTSVNIDADATPNQQSTIKILLNGESFILPKRKDGSPSLFLDLIGMLDIDTSNPQGKIVLRINGNDASYLEQLSEGDKVEVYWENIHENMDQMEPDRRIVPLP